MNGALALEPFGYLGSFPVPVSVLMTSVVRLRVINLIGSAIFAAYAVLIRSFPTALLNGCPVGINLYHLLKLRNTAGDYELQPVRGREGFIPALPFGGVADYYAPAITGLNTACGEYTVRSPVIE